MECMWRVYIVHFAATCKSRLNWLKNLKNFEKIEKQISKLKTEN